LTEDPLSTAPRSSDSAQIVGGVMIGTGMRFVFGGDPQRAYAVGGWLKPVHAALMHGILVLPLLAWQISKMDWDERTQSQAVRTGIAVYALVVLAAVAVSGFRLFGRTVL
jgi:hypothetical protein